MVLKLVVTAFFISASTLLSTSAVAANTSAYTDFSTKHCKTIEQTSDEGGFYAGACKGYHNIPMYYAEGDLRGNLAIGDNAENHCAAHQTFSGFNGPGNKLEWRLQDGKPFAVIHRWTVSDPMDDTKSSSWLVVMKLAPDNSCRAAIIEGAYPNANEEARKAADTIVPGFDCAKDMATVISRADAPQYITQLPCTPAP